MVPFHGDIVVGRVGLEPTTKKESVRASRRWAFDSSTVTLEMHLLLEQRSVGGSHAKDRSGRPVGVGRPLRVWRPALSPAGGRAVWLTSWR